jgi:O-antigen/teichoic acid export membrane protein
MQLTFAIPQQRNMTEVAEVTVLTILSTITMLLALAVAGITYGLIAQTAIGTVHIAIFGLLLVPFLVLSDMGKMLSARDGAFAAIGRQNLIFAGLRVLIQLVGGALGGSYLFLVLGESLGRLGSLAASRISFWRTWHASRVSVLDLRAALRTNWRFPAISVPSTLLDNLGGYLPPLLIGYLYGIEAAGWFFLAQRFVALPNILLVQTTADVIQVRAAQIMLTNRSGLKPFVLKTSALLLLAGLIVAPSLLVAVRFAWPLLFGTMWEPARLMAYALILSSIPQCVCGPTSRLLIVANRQPLKLIFDVIFLSAALSPLLVKYGGYSIGATGAVWAISTGYLIAYSVYFGLILFAALRPIDLKRSRPENEANPAPNVNEISTAKVTD